MGKFNWTYLGALFSVAFGWFLNELGQWFRTRNEDKKIKKQILYNLLKTYFIFNQLDTSEITQMLTNRILLRIQKNEQTEELKQYLNQLYSGIIGGLLQNNISDKITTIEKKYTKAVDSLATIDPITAYSLNGKTNIMQSFDLLQEYFEEVKGHFPGEEELVQNQISSSFDALKPEIIKEAISDLEDDIKNIAYSINPWTWIKVKSSFQSSKDIIKNEGEKKIDELLDKLIPKATE
jgi:hypothetical protein